MPYTMLRSSLKLFLAGLLLVAGIVTAQADARGKDFVLVIDAGHGGHDAGACGSFSKEKDINLKVALEVGRLVQNNCPEVKVVYTRKTDVFVPLQRRADIANRNKANLFISIHTNSLPEGKIAYGAETYTLGMARADANLEVAKRENSVIVYEKNYQQTYKGFDPNKTESYIIFELMQDRYMKESVELARYIQQQYVNTAGRKNKGVHQAGFLVLRNTSMPAVLTELGFISTPAEERFLNTKEGVKKLGRSIYNGFKTYYDRYQARLAGVQSASAAPVAEAEPETPTDTPKPAATPQPAKATKSETANTSREDTPASEPVPSRKAEATDSAATDGRPVFKVQVLASSKQIAADDKQLKGLAPIEVYRDNGLYKYTYGSSTDYQEMKQVRKDILDRFPEAFIVAFVNGERVGLGEAIRMSKK